MGAIILIIGAVLGFSSVAFGAYIEHGLRNSLDSETLRFVMTALRYHQLYAPLIAVIGIFVMTGFWPQSVQFKLVLAAFIFMAGILLFSVSIYAGALLQNDIVYNLAPFGGFALMGGWLVLIWAGISVLIGSHS